MAVALPLPVPRGAPLRRLWLSATIVCTLGAFAVTVALAPGGTTSPTRALQWLLFVTSSVHVASTGWFFTVADVRAHARQHRTRYVAVPAALVLGAAGTAVTLPTDRFDWLLLGFFGWQFFHFQKQNLGMAALAGISTGVGSVSRPERRALMAAGVAGIAGLVVHPRLLQLTLDVRLSGAFPVAGTAFGLAVCLGVAATLRRPRARSSWGYRVVYLSSLLFFLPVFVFGNPYAAVAGLVVAHGAQYLVIVGLVAGADTGRRAPVLSLALLLNVALIGGLLLNAASHQHGGPWAARLVYGAYLGAVMAHFVVDAGLWRLRDEFPRRFLDAALPYLLEPGSAAATTAGRP